MLLESIGLITELHSFTSGQVSHRSHMSQIVGPNTLTLYACPSSASSLAWSSLPLLSQACLDS